MNRQKQFRLISAINLVLLFVAFALCAWLSSRYYFEMDLTRSGRHTLSRASIEVLTQANKPLSIKAYAREDSELRSLIKRFIGKFQSIKPDINLQFVNPDAVPDEVRQLGINVNGELVLHYENRTEHVKTDSEQDFVNALQRLLRGTERWLAFLYGHGERHPSGKANHDLGEWAKQLNYRGFKFRAVNLVETVTVPDNTGVLIVASPLVALLPGEVDIIVEYLNQGGNLMWLVEPNDQSGMGKISELLGITVSSGTVIDTEGQLLGIDDPTITLTTARLYPNHPITEGFDLTVFFPRTTVISFNNMQGWSSRPVLNSGNHTWLELGDLQGEVDFDPQLEQQGPLTLGLSLERELESSVELNPTKKQQRVLVIGDGDFLSNAYVGNSGNLELGMRAINWLSHDDSFITLPARTLEDTQLNMSQFMLGAFGIGFLYLLPVVFLVAGLFIWWHRKKL